MTQDIPLFPSRIVFFDGVCHFCNRSVRLIRRNDRRGRFYFAPLQGTTAKMLLAEENQQTPSSIIYRRNGKNHDRSQALLFIAWDMDGLWKLFVVFFLIPPFIRDLVYNWFAARRYRWFGRYESCSIPGPEEQASYLP